MRFRLRSFGCFVGLFASLSLAQAPPAGANPTKGQIEASMRLQASSVNIQAWLKSKDPRLIAWGAYFARENNDAAGLTLAAQLVQASLWQGGPGLLSPDAPHVEALSEVLDALIQRRFLISADLLGYISQSHPIQTIILLSMLPPAERTGNLLQWYGGVRPAGYEHLDRVSAMLLSKAPPPGFAANVLEDAEEDLTISIVPKDNTGVGVPGSIMGRACGDFAVIRSPDEWPEPFSYHLTENDSASIDPLLVEAGGDRISWQRSNPGRGFRTCVGGVRGLTPETRHHLLAGMLGVRDDAMVWPTQKIVYIAKEKDEQVERRIGATILAERRGLLQSVERFQSMGLITPQEAKTALPKLSVHVSYDGFPDVTEERTKLDGRK